MSEPDHSVDRVLEHASQRTPGGCDSCDAYQTVAKADGLWTITVHHDDECPVWARIRRAG